MKLKAVQSLDKMSTTLWDMLGIHLLEFLSNSASECRPLLHNTAALTDVIQTKQPGLLTEKAVVHKPATMKPIS
jgi:hypothetical protein